MKVDESVYNTIMKAQEVTLTNYGEEIYWRDAENIDGYIEDDTLLTIIDDLIYEINSLQEKIEDLETPKEELDEYDPHDKWLDYQRGTI